MAAVFVPARVIADRPIHWEVEISQCLGGRYWFGGLAVPPPTLGVYACLELLDSAYVKAWPNCTSRDVGHAVAACFHGRDALSLVARHVAAIAGADPAAVRTALDGAADECLARAGDTAGTVPALVGLHTWFSTAFAGYGMLPAGSSPGRPWLFGAPTMGGTVAAMGAALGVSYDALLWEVPLCLLGFTAAGLAELAGTKGVARPKDPADVKAQLAAAKAREAIGELHPWQLAEPAHYPLTASQRANPASVARYVAALAAINGTGGNNG